MTENGKKFLEQVSKDKALQAELQKAQGEALSALLKDKGLEDAAAKAGTEAMLKVASAHGVKLTAEDLKPAKLEPLSEDEMKAVAGGASCTCPLAGMGGGDDLDCACLVGGMGMWHGFSPCACAVYGSGDLDDLK